MTTRTNATTSQVVKLAEFNHEQASLYIVGKNEVSFSLKVAADSKEAGLEDTIDSLEHFLERLKTDGFNDWYWEKLTAQEA